MGSVEVSPYTLEKIIPILDSAKSLFREYSELLGEGREIETREKLKEYKEALNMLLEKLKEIVGKYPSDREIGNYYSDFNTFYEERHKFEVEEELSKLEDFFRSIRHIIDWRLVRQSSGKELPFKDYRSLRGSHGRRRI